MWHQNGKWNFIWSDMMIEHGYGHGSNGMAGLAFNEKALNCWAKSLHLSSIVEKKPV